MAARTIHLRPQAELAERVLVPGDPGRALLIAQRLLEAPRMFNHHRGLWGYTGRARADGELLSVQSTGMGGPSAAIVMHELIELGARRLIRVGTCGALVGGLELGTLVVAETAQARDGTSRALGAAEQVAADPTLTATLRSAAGPGTPTGATASVDVFYGPLPAGTPALVVEMECATVFQVAVERGAAAAGLLAVTDTFGPGEARRRIDDAGLVRAGERLGDVAGRALGSGQDRAPAGRPLATPACRPPGAPEPG